MNDNLNKEIIGGRLNTLMVLLELADEQCGPDCPEVHMHILAGLKSVYALLDLDDDQPDNHAYFV